MEGFFWDDMAEDWYFISSERMGLGASLILRLAARGGTPKGYNFLYSGTREALVSMMGCLRESGSNESPLTLPFILICITVFLPLNDAFFGNGL